MTVTVETEASIAAHQHASAFVGHTPDWYANFGSKCPTCGVVPEFEEIEIEQIRGNGIKLFGLSSGERVNQ